MSRKIEISEKAYNTLKDRQDVVGIIVHPFLERAPLLKAVGPFLEMDRDWIAKRSRFGIILTTFILIVAGLLPFQAVRNRDQKPNRSGPTNSAT